MYLIIGIAFLLCGAVMIIKPRLFFDLTESWKNNAPSDPTSTYIFSTRFGGIAVSIVGVASIVVQFL